MTTMSKSMTKRILARGGIALALCSVIAACGEVPESRFASAEEAAAALVAAAEQ